MTREKLLSPKELGEIVGLSTAQVRALMNDGRLEFVEISSKTKMLTLSGWERFKREATKIKHTAVKQSSLPIGEPPHSSL
ncbi:hypothetical protein [Ruegeria sp. HKCCD7559]|uniref:hypothetical protein n=1 Tax=Ruegeria sp. HKCCD7559 TaxID=2683005 RepID=UPI00149326C9|nr:hypothetical protein [Ruegeria sp. HKCCD7559]NOC47005.1 hypothetical protein [Ruegeria sp. HKCCD7559]